MSMTELSTIVEHNLNPIVFVLNNHGFATERCLKDGGFNNLREWAYHDVVKIFGGEGALVTTEGELEEAVKKALDSKKLFVINVSVGKSDISPGLKRMIGALAEKI
jgi:indolepyruvate decarboxylase